MKELSIREKAKAYDMALERAKDYHKQLLDEDNPEWASEIEKIFPKLKESEGERIRKKLISYFSAVKGFSTLEYNYGITNEEAISWLEKQGDDKVEQKFKIGDWVVFNNNHQSIYQVEKIEDGYYILRHTHGGTFRVCVLHDESLRPWTIQDAKNGDVLAFYSEYRGNKMVQAGIIEKYVGKHGGCSNTFKIYVGVNWDNNLQIGEYMGCSDIRPATKEQRDDLMKAMADADYTFDFEKKELKKIVVPIFHIGDRVRYKGHACDGVITEIIDTYYICGNAKLPISTQDKLELVEKKPAWNEKDEKEVAVLEAYIRSKDWSNRHIDRALGIIDELVKKLKGK